MAGDGFSPPKKPGLLDLEYEYTCCIHVLYDTSYDNLYFVYYIHIYYAYILTYVSLLLVTSHSARG